MKKSLRQRAAYVLAFVLVTAVLAGGVWRYGYVQGLGQLEARGQADLALGGAAELQGDMMSLSFDLNGTGMRSGMAELDRLMGGDIETTGAVAVDATQMDLQYLKLVSTHIRANATGSGPGEPVTFSARLSDLALLTPGLSGQTAVRGTLTLQDRLAERVTVNLDGTGPGGITAKITGAINEYGQAMALELNGDAPLQLANPFISPRSVQGPASFDLRLDGPPRLSSLSGALTFSGASVALPRLDYSLRDLGGDVALAGGQAAVDISGGVAGTDGRFEATGPISLTPPYSANLAIQLLNLGLRDLGLYQTTVNGNVNVDGALLGGARIAGTINLGRTELRVPSGSGVIIGTLPELRHVGEPRDVALTRARAGLTGDATQSGASFPIDLTINAPNRIFVRGRGLDAELGGSVRLTGTTSDVSAGGVFELIRGRLDILGKRLDLTQGLIDMRGSLDPYLFFVAETAEDDVVVRVILEGLASEPNVLFTSDPELPQEEVVARLLFGRGLDTISPFQAAQLVGAVATLSGRYNGGLTGRLRKSLGLSDLDISTTNEGATQLRAGAYISDNIYSEVVADSDGRNEINLNIDINKRVTVRGSADNQGETGIGIFFEKDY